MGLHLNRGYCPSLCNADRLRPPSTSEASQINANCSMAVLKGRFWGIKMTPGLFFPAMNFRKCCGIVRTSCDTSIRFCSAAIWSTVGSSFPTAPASYACMKFKVGSRRRSPSTMARRRFSSARNWIFMRARSARGGRVPAVPAGEGGWEIGSFGPLPRVFRLRSDTHQT